MIVRLFKAIAGLLIAPFRVKLFYAHRLFKGKRVALVGPADSAYQSDNGRIIDGFDYVIRINKALVTWNKKNERYLGTRTDILFHNFHENMDTGGGGPLDIKLYKEFGVKYLIQPRFDMDGWRSIFNYFKKYLNVKQVVHVLPYWYYKNITDMFEDYHPTKGFCALYAALTSSCEEVFITGFTFFKTPYAKGYRDNIRDTSANKEHIQKQGLHDIDLEYNNFILLLKNTTNKNIYVDKKLYDILSADSIELVKKIKVLG